MHAEARSARGFSVILAIAFLMLAVLPALGFDSFGGGAAK